MKVAITGPSSTGKTTLMDDLLATNQMNAMGFQSARVDIRHILRKLGLRADGVGFSRRQMRDAQWAILEEKQRVESSLGRVIVDRSYLDLAAHWIARDGNDDEETASYVGRCNELASGYDLHIFLPMGRIPFVADGERPEDMGLQRRINDNIEELLNAYTPNVLVLRCNDRKQCVGDVLFKMQI